LTEGHRFKIYGTAEFRSPSLIVGWSQDAGKLGPNVIDFLKRKLDAQDFAEIEPSEFFPATGVLIEDDIVQLPEAKFFSCEEKDILLFKSDGPGQAHYEFLTALLEVAQHHCRAVELYTIGGIISVMDHSGPRRVSAIANQPQLKRTLAAYDIETNLNYETPPGGRPTLSSFLLWAAKRRNIAGAALWTEVPFYLAATEDPRACKQVLTILDKKFNLGTDLAELDWEIEKQDEKIEELKGQDSDIHKYIEMLQRGMMLSETESEKLAERVTEFLGKRG